jgi:hypothetical protein
MPQSVTAEVFEAQGANDLVPVGRVTQDGRGDATASRPGEESGIGSAACRVDPVLDHFAYFDDERNGSGAFALGALVGEAAGRGRGLAADGPCPVVRVDVTDATAGYFADACSGAGGGDDDVAPASVMIG